jgi:repressor LexA
VLTPRQQQIFDLIRRQLAKTGLPPTRAEIARTLGFKSPNAAEEHLQALARKGAIELVPGASRGIRIIQDDDSQGLPVVGRVAAGHPILAQENIEDRVSLDARLFRPRADYLLRVHGMSMRDAGILDGDLLAVHRVREAANGQIVVARIDNEVTVKRWTRRGDIVRLMPANLEFQPIEVDLRHTPLEIEGVGVGIIRAGTLR